MTTVDRNRIQQKRTAPIRVVFVSHTASMYGAEMSLVQLLASFDRSIVSPHVILPGRGLLESHLREIGVPYSFATYQPWLAERNPLPVFAARGLISWLGLVGFVLSVMRLKPAVIVSNSLVIPQGAFAAALIGVPHIWHVRELLGPNPALRGPLPLTRILTLVANYADRVIAVSEAARTQFPESVRSRVVTIHNGIPSDFGATFEGRGSAVDRPSGPRLAVIGALSPTKRQVDAIETVAVLASRYPDMSLVLLGSGKPSYQRKLEGLARARGLEHRVSFYGYVNDPRQALADVDVVLVPSSCESFGLATVEALALGIPVVAADAGGSREILGRGGGVLVPPRRPDLMADAVEGLLRSRDLMEELGRQGRQVASGFSTHREAREIEREIEEVARNGRRRG